jgi:hypothetical protein
VSIVIPSFEAGDYLRACIESIAAFSSSTPFEIIIVDNASSAAVVEYLKELDRLGRARVILNQANLGFTHAVNQGIEVASPNSDVVILNNDAVVTRGWLESLQQLLHDYPDVGLIVPRQVVLSGENTAPVHQPGANFLRECDVNLSIHHARGSDRRSGRAWPGTGPLPGLASLLGSHDSPRRDPDGSMESCQTAPSKLPGNAPTTHSNRQIPILTEIQNSRPLSVLRVLHGRLFYLT